MDHILFSLPVHERPDIVADQIANIRHFCPDSTVCIHVSSQASDDIDVYRRHCDGPNVIFNPHRLETIYCKGILHTHLSNFEHAATAGVAFDKLMLISSNEMLIKPGLSEHVSRYQLGAQTEVFDRSVDWHRFRDHMLENIRLKHFLDELGFPVFFGGQAEGQFFSRSIFVQLYNLYIKHFPMGPCGFETEEILPATIAAFKAMGGVDLALPVTVCDYCVLLKTEAAVVDKIRQEKGALFTVKLPKALRSPHHNSSTLSGAFSVKRVPREDSPLRRYIRGLEAPVEVSA
jgi:hypothetical protein